MNIIGAILSPILSIIDKAVPDVAEATRLKAEIEKAVISNQSQIIGAMKDIAVAEVTGNKFQSSWRPMLAYLLIFLLAWTYVLVPLVGAFGIAVEAPPADGIANLLTVFGGVYGLGRTVEKVGPSMVKTWKGEK